MDVLETVQKYLTTWEKGGKSECRNIVLAPHSNPSDPGCNDVLTTVYHALIGSTLLTWSPKKPLSVDAFVAFVQSVLDHLPSSSIASDKSANVISFGEILVDAVWSIDSELEEILADAKNAASSAEQGAMPAATVAQIVKAKKNAEADKETLVLVVKRLLSIGVLDVDVCRERLDLSLVASVGLIADKAAFERKEIRARTGLFYKQNKFNLLREQSEGYSKLTTELTSSLGPPHSSASGRPMETSDAIDARARPAWERTVGLIGYFDLDPNRALDIILDVFSVHLMTHHKFFIAFLSFSPWGRKKRSVKREDERSMAVDSEPAQYKGKTLDEVMRLAEAQTGVSDEIKDSSNTRVLGQVLGFKFTYYQSPDVTETTPRNLYLLAAILIREGFLTVEDLYPHITPSDDKMDDYHKAYLSNVQSRISGARVSQLAMAGPLDSSGSTPKPRAAAPEPEKTVKVKEVPNQRRVAIMSKYPWMIDAYPEVADLMLRILTHSISSLYDTTWPTKEATSGFMHPRQRYGSAGMVPAPDRRPLLTLMAPTPTSTSSIDFVFFFPDWSQRIPVCSTLDDIIDVLEPLMQLVGLHMSHDSTFWTKLVRLGRTHMGTAMQIDPEKKGVVSDLEHPTYSFWFKMLRRYFIPALPLLRGNGVCSVELWRLLSLFEVTLRWRLYGEWKMKTYQSHPELRVRQVQADRESKGILRRLSHDTLDSLSGAVAKLAHTDPIIFFTNAVKQIMAYDNLASVIVQAVSYVTLVGFDVLGYVIIDAMADPNKDRVKDDGVNTSDWLQNLASFSGMLYRNFSADMTPLLKYVVHQLYNGQTTEIIVLRELIWKMVGIEPLPSLSDSQIAAMAGGPTLRIEAVASTTRGARVDPSNGTHLRAPSRIGKYLMDSSLALPLLIQIAQQRQSCVFRAPDAHLKSLASLYDTTHGVLLQYLEMLNSPTVISSQDYAENVLPSLTELNEKYGISAPICMQIIRPVLNAALLAAALAMQEKERVESVEAERRLKAALTAKREPNASTSRVASPSLGESSANPEASAESKTPIPEAQSTDVPMEISEAPAPTPENPWVPELYRLFDDIKKIAPGNAAEVLGSGFYLTFWQIRQEDSKYTAAERSPDKAKRAIAPVHRDRRNRVNNYVYLLSQELKQQTAARTFTIKRVAREKQHWFAHNPKAATLASSFVEHCLQPRCLLSPMDADFCAQFIKMVHVQGTPGFPTLLCYDKLLGEHVRVVVFSCSEYEARNYGRFLFGILTDLSRWFNDEQLFIQENRSKIGGKLVYFPGLQLRFASKPTIAQEDIIKWPDFKLIMRKWCRKLTKGLVDCIESGEFMHVYNAIIVLKEILPVFPVAAVNEFSGPTLARAMERLLEKEERGDLKILARAYFASLKKREPIWLASSAHMKAATPAKGLPVSADKTRTNAPPMTPGHATGDTRRMAPAPPPSTPSAPRAQLLNGVSSATGDRPTATKLALESIPRPEVVKRIRPEPKVVEEIKSNGVKALSKADAMDVDSSAVPPPASVRENGISDAAKVGSPIPVATSDFSRASHGSRPPTPAQPSSIRPPPLRSLPQSPRATSVVDAKAPRAEPQQAMPPPSTPSQTLSAQELRETAKQTRSSTENVEEKQLPSEPRGQAGAPPAPSPSRRRSPSPDRDRESRKEREASARGSTAAAPTSVTVDERGLPSRPDTTRHRPEDSLGKRRRPADDEPDRSSKRASRKDSHHEDRSRRSSEKDGHDRGRDSERRRKERDVPEPDSRILSIDTKLSDKRVPDGPASAKALPPTTPSAPRAMTSGDGSRLKAEGSLGRDRDWKAQREQPPHAVPSKPAGGASNGPSQEPMPGGSLRQRIGDEAPRSLPQAPLSYRSEPMGDRKGGTSARDDERDSGRKRTLSEREKDGNDAAPGVNEQTAQAPKRPRIIRNRYESSTNHGLAKKLLPIDPQLAEKSRSGRKD
ncbi:THO complex subunit 2 [Grifola frondosa]|uniref:THO complex subunit 2 n=1 Tax=Grifola frondosa TaxID=5627 RepID=A0A1C7MN40_GRIFR|nr:THO complex subunit 2 [Grifola frondosa]